MLSDVKEVPIDPSIPVIDSHHHLFDRADNMLADITGRQRFVVEDYSEFVGKSHNVVASIAVECHTRYRTDGPENLRPVGETEFLNEQADLSASGLYGSMKVAAGIVAYADLTQGERVREVLEAHTEAAPQRFKGVRQVGVWDEDPNILGDLFSTNAHLYQEEGFLKGMHQLGSLGLSFDAFVLSPQLKDISVLARRAAETQIILNHLGHPVGIGRHEGKLEDEFPMWREDMTEIAKNPNVVVKMGGLGSFLAGSITYRSQPPASSQTLADEWRNYAQTTIELFGPHRVMFESNLPTDGSGSFSNVCNAYPRITEQYSPTERGQIFAGTAARIYRLDIDTAP